MYTPLELFSLRPFPGSLSAVPDISHASSTGFSGQNFVSGIRHLASGAKNGCVYLDAYLADNAHITYDIPGLTTVHKPHFRPSNLAPALHRLHSWHIHALHEGAAGVVTLRIMAPGFNEHGIDIEQKYQAYLELWSLINFTFNNPTQTTQFILHINTILFSAPKMLSFKEFTSHYKSSVATVGTPEAELSMLVCNYISEFIISIQEAEYSSSRLTSYTLSAGSPAPDPGVEYATPDIDSPRAYGLVTSNGSSFFPQDKVLTRITKLKTVFFKNPPIELVPERLRLDTIRQQVDTLDGHYLYHVSFAIYNAPFPIHLFITLGGVGLKNLRNFKSQYSLEALDLDDENATITLEELQAIVTSIDGDREKPKEFLNFKLAVDRLHKDVLSQYEEALLNPHKGDKAILVVNCK